MVEVYCIRDNSEDSKMGNTVEIRLSQEELDVLRESIDAGARSLSQELEESFNSRSDSEIIEVADKLRAAQAAKYKLDIQVTARA